MQLNKLEEVIVASAVKAQSTYMDMTGGQWISHGPELFLQCEVARDIWKRTNSWVYIDACGRKVREELRVTRGPTPKAARLRSDISVWHANNTIRAIIEIKRASAYELVCKDALKVERALRSPHGGKTAYLLVYSESTAKHKSQTLERRFLQWEKNLNERKHRPCWSLLKTTIKTSGSVKWVWGVALYRLTRGQS